MQQASTKARREGLENEISVLEAEKHEPICEDSEGSCDPVLQNIIDSL